MLYKFKSKAGSDVIMLAIHATQVLAAFGRQGAAKGIVEVLDLPQAIQSLEQAFSQESALAKQTLIENENEEPTTQVHSETVSLHQRAWPLLMLMKQAQKEGHVITWGE